MLSDEEFKRLVDSVQGAIAEGIKARPNLQRSVLLPFEPLTIRPWAVRDGRKPFEAEGSDTQTLRTQRAVQLDGLVIETEGTASDVSTIEVTQMMVGASPLFGVAGAIPITYFQRVLRDLHLRHPIYPGVDVTITYRSNVQEKVLLRAVAHGGHLQL